MTIIIGFAVTTGVLFLRGYFTADTDLDRTRILCDAFFVPSVVFFSAAALKWSSRCGTFDMIRYGVLSTFRLLSARARQNTKDTFYDYRRQRQMKKAPAYAHLVIAGILFMIPAVVLISLIEM